jgi:hypothetical protein
MYFVLVARPEPLVKEICKTLVLRLKYKHVPTPFAIHMEAALAGGLNEMVEELIGRADSPRVDDNLQAWEGLTALHLAAKYGQHEMLTKMLKHAVNINKLSRNPSTVDGDRLNFQFTPLFVAVTTGNVCCANVLLLNGAHVDTIGTSLLAASALRGYNEMVHLLLRYGADSLRVFYRGSNLLECALLNFDHPHPYKERLSARTVWKLVTQVALVGGPAPRKVVEALERNIVFDVEVPNATDMEELMKNAKNERRQWREVMALERRHHTLSTFEE